MTVLRQRMIEDMQLRGLAEKTQDAYMRAVRQQQFPLCSCLPNPELL